MCEMTEEEVKLWTLAVKRWAERSHCEKNQVAAIIVDPRDGYVIGRGVNGPTLPIPTTCPRLGVKTGERYELCRETCGRDTHAEVAALYDAYEHHTGTPRPVEGCVMFVTGHDYICEACNKIGLKAGIERFVLV